MKGASAEPWDTTRSNPTRSRTTRIGASQYFLLLRVNSQNSLRTLALDIGSGPSVHLLVVLGIPLALGVGFPVRRHGRRAAAQGIPSCHALHEPDGGQCQEEDDR